MTQTSDTSIKENFNLSVLAKDAGIVLGIQFAGIFITYLMEVCLAQWLGKAEYGIYQYVIAWSVLMAIPAGLGLPITTLRFVAEYRVKEAWGLLWGIVQSSWLLTILASLLLGSVTAIGIFFWNDRHPFTYAIPLLIGIGLIPLQALINLQVETARATQDMTLAYGPSKLLWPVMLLLSASLFLEINHTLTENSAIIIAEITLFLVVLFQLSLLWLKLGQEFESAQPIYALKQWLSVALIMSLNHGCFLFLANTDTIMVGSILGSESAGMYAAAVKTARWVSFVYDIINFVAAPSFVILYTQNNKKELQRIVSEVSIWIFWPSVAIALLLIGFSQPILGLFGSEFMPASWQLKILVSGNLFSALCGSVGYLIVMTGHQNKSAIVMVSAVIINVVLNAIAIPLIGGVGAAIATALTTALWSISLAILVIKYVGVNPMVYRKLWQQEPPV
ncbi:MAG: polysaccharide biosynthesis C-terminal domain-containing protein [Cyanobacteria bacterium SBLK]|nr:polysaccharide biosynthesis C-terminal domain-containing protein [Cyanobacteria bacterium SBLK]